MPQCLDKNRLSAPRFSRERTKGSGLDQMRGRRRKGNYKTRGKRSREQRRRWFEWEWKWGMKEGRNQGGENKRAEMADENDDAYAFPILSRPNQPPAGTFCLSRPPQMTERRLSPKESFLSAARNEHADLQVHFVLPFFL